MSLKSPPPASGGDFEQPPPGNHPAILIGLIDIGPQESTYEGVTSIRDQLIMRWELPTETMSDGQPYIVSAFVTNSMHSKAKLRGWVQSWTGEKAQTLDEQGFDLNMLLGTGCMLNIIHDHNERARVSSVAQLPKGITIPKQHNRTTTFDFDTDMDRLSEQPEWIQKFVMRSTEYGKPRLTEYGKATEKPIVTVDPELKQKIGNMIKEQDAWPKIQTEFKLASKRDVFLPENIHRIHQWLYAQATIAAFDDETDVPF